MVNRKKTKAVTVYFDPKYAEKLDYIRDTEGMTSFFTRALDSLEMDPEKLEAVRKLRHWREIQLSTEA